MQRAHTVLQMRIFHALFSMYLTCAWRPAQSLIVFHISIQCKWHVSIHWIRDFLFTVQNQFSLRRFTFCAVDGHESQSIIAINKLMHYWIWWVMKKFISSAIAISCQKVTHSLSLYRFENTFQVNITINSGDDSSSDGGGEQAVAVVIAVLASTLKI